ncbi:iron ABC transporter permease [Cardiobacteriaceae bacterium TAE3-ERU3]|nr:iron ABC transporter permease [Cardiobacteriaceae bacterium TAE3-ERU3]
MINSIALESGTRRRWSPSTSRLPVLLLWLAVLTLTLSPTLMLLWTVIKQFPVLQNVLQDGATWRATWHSLYTSALATLISLVLGSAVAYIVVLTDIRAKALWVFGLMLPMMIPPQVTALAWLQLFGPASPLLNTIGIAPPLGSPQPLYSAGGIALLMGIQHAPLVFMALRSTLVHLPHAQIEAARISDASPRRVWLETIFPLSRAALITGAALAFVSALGNFGIPAMLGIPVSYYVLPTLIYQKMAGYGTTVLAQVASLSMLIGVIALLGVALQQYWLNRSSYQLLGHSGRSHSLKLGRWHWPVMLGLALLLTLILLVPLTALVVSSLVKALGMPLNAQTLSFTAYLEMFTRQGATIRAFGNSLFLATAAAVILMLLSVPIALCLRNWRGLQRNVFTAVVDLPYALPGIVLAIACILLFVRPLPLINISLYGTLSIILIAYVMRFLAVALKPVLSAVEQLDPTLERAARLAGANRWQRLRDVVLPLIAPSVCAGGLLVFLIAVNELTVSALLWSVGNETIGVMIFNLDESGNSVLAAAVSVVVVAMVIALMLLLSLLSRWLPAGVIPWQTSEEK